MPYGMPCRTGYHAAWDTMLRGTPCRPRYHAAPGRDLLPVQNASVTLTKAAMEARSLQRFLPTHRSHRRKCNAYSQQAACTGVGRRHAGGRAAHDASDQRYNGR
jgi:hypothetical protein